MFSAGCTYKDNAIQNESGEITNSQAESADLTYSQAASSDRTTTVKLHRIKSESNEAGVKSTSPLTLNILVKIPWLKKPEGFCTYIKISKE